MRYCIFPCVFAAVVLAWTGIAGAEEYGKSASAKDGMVAAAHPLAVDAGLEMLRQGGNAADAAAAAAFALTVAEPFGSSIGGDGVSLVYSKTDKRVASYAYRCQAPAAATEELFDLSKRDEWSKTIKAPAIPGMVKGTLAMHEDFGLLSREQIMAPAIRYARSGFEVEPVLAGLISDMYGPLSEREETARVFLDDFLPPETGMTLRNPDLADSLELISEHGADVMYHGELARRITSYLQENGGVPTFEDFQNYSMIESEPLMIDYKGYEVYGPPPPFGGIAILQALQLYERIDISGFPGAHSPENIHALAEVMKLSSADRYEVAGDPRVVDVPSEWIISEEYADQRIADYNPEMALEDDVPAGEVWGQRNSDGSTTHLTVVDSQGNTVVLTQTLGSFFGSTVMVPGTGIMLNNQMKNFSRREGSPNNLEPGKSMNSTQSPVIVLKDGELVLAMGSPGSYRILTTVFQFLVYTLDYGMELQEANDAPRIASRYTWHNLNMEKRIPEDVRSALEKKGHSFTVRDAYDIYFGGVHAVWRDLESGVLTGSADRRRDGVARGLELEQPATAE